jgi:hypothetical protein
VAAPAVVRERAAALASVEAEALLEAQGAAPPEAQVAEALLEVQAAEASAVAAEVVDPEAAEWTQVRRAARSTRPGR